MKTRRLRAFSGTNLNLRFTALGVLTALFMAVPARGELLRGRVDQILLTGDSRVYSYRDGVVARDGETLSAGGESARRAERVALFLLLLEREPFFLSPGTGPGEMAHAVSLLQRETSLVMRGLGSERPLYPEGFLAAYASASSAFNVLASSPSEQGAAEVLKKIALGVEAYGAEAESISSDVEKRFRVSNITRLAMNGGHNVADKTTVLSDFALIKKNAAAAEKRYGQLRDCLLKSSASCFTVLPAPGPVPEAAAAVKPPPFPPVIADGLREDGPRGPYLLDSSCWDGRSENYLYALRRCERGGACMEWGTLATNAFFREPRPEVPSQAKVLEKGYKLIHQSAAAPYGCNNLEYKAVLQVLDHAAVNYSSSPVFAGLDLAGPAFSGLSGPIAKVLKAEKEFAGEKIRSQRALERLGLAYYTAWKAFLEGGHYLTAQKLLGRWRVINLKTANFWLVLNRLRHHMASYRKTMLDVELRPDPLARTTSLFLTKTHYSLVFMPFSPSVWLLPEKPAYLLPGTRISGVASVMGYDEAVKKYGAREVRKALESHGEIHEGGYMGGPPAYPVP